MLCSFNFNFIIFVCIFKDVFEGVEFIIVGDCKSLCFWSLEKVLFLCELLIILLNVGVFWVFVFSFFWDFIFEINLSLCFGVWGRNLVLDVLIFILFLDKLESLGIKWFDCIVIFCLDLVFVFDFL